MSEENPAKRMKLPRLRLENLPKFSTPASVKKFVGGILSVPVKIKKAPKWNYAFLTFNVQT